MPWILAREMRLGSERKSDNAAGFNIEEIRAIRNINVYMEYFMDTRYR